MRKSIFPAAVCALGLTFTGTSAAAPITYNVNVGGFVPSGSVMGTITTDGIIGTLFNGDIIDWNLMLTDPSGTADMTPSDSSVFISGGSLIALNSTLLVFDFNNSGAFVNFNGPSPGCPPQWSLRTGGGTACNGTTGDAMGISTVDPVGSGVYRTDVAGQAIILETGAAVPEPGSASLMVIGVVGLIGLRLVGLRKRRSRPSPLAPADS